jgi:hypothetical protein
MAAAAFASLEWKSASMPGSTQPVQLARLPAASDGAFRAFVRFPPGWHRAEAGHYAAAEEFFVLEGALELNGSRWSAGGHAWIPAYRPRRDLGSAPGCLVFAWFSAAPRWIPGAPPRDARLNPAPRHRTVIVPRAQVSCGEGCETLGLQDLAWQADEAHLLAAGASDRFLMRRWPGTPVATAGR